MTNIEVILLALSAVKKTIHTNYNETSANHGTFFINDDKEGSVQIDCVKGDNFVLEKKTTNVSVIKIDVEGFEYDVISGLSETIRQYNPVILFEFDTNYIGRNDKTALDFDQLLLIALGYSLFIIEKDILLPCASLQTISGMKEILALKDVI